jgi:hypothetical protein
MFAENVSAIVKIGKFCPRKKIRPQTGRQRMQFEISNPGFQIRFLRVPAADKFSFLFRIIRRLSRAKSSGVRCDFNYLT